MSEPFLGEIAIFGFNFAPRGWAFCDGQLIPISQNTALFSLLGTIYGGDGTTTFALPNLQGRAPMNAGQGPGLSPRGLGESGGNETETLQQSQIPAHRHTLKGINQLATTTQPGGNLFARGAGFPPYTATANAANLDAQGIAAAGGSQPHNNMMPYLTLNFCIALQGIYPPRP